ncbi:MAG TPA: hypothetical protein VF060_18790 [Trebonia sp.]
MQSRLGAVRTAAVLAAIVAVGAAGCSSGGSSSSSPATKVSAMQELAATVKKMNDTQQVKTYVASLALQVGGIPGSSGDFSMAGTIESQRQPSPLAEFDASSFQMSGQSVGSMTEIVTPKAAYMKMPMLSAELHKEWIELPFSSLKRNGAGLSQLISQAQDTDPLSATQLLAGAKNARTVGTGTVGGVAVTELAGSEPINAGLAKLPASMRTSLGQEMEQLGVGQVTFQVWIDGQHDIRKAIVKEIGGTLNETMSFTVTGINQPVSISVPAPSQVATIPASALSGM